MKISLAMIVRDDESTLEECLQSIRPHVDEICICDTGSTDRSPEIAKKYADKFEQYLGCNDSEGRITDFADARNRSFEMVTGDWTIWIDGDDVVRGAEHLRTLCAQATADYHTWLFPYEYARDGMGAVTTLQMRERLMRPPHAYIWRSPVHEYAGLAEDPPAGSTVSNIASDLVAVEHRSHLSKKAREPGRNLRILKNHVERVGNADTRALYYLGIEYQSAGEHGQALRYLREYVGRAEWADEKCRALLAIGEFYRQLGDHDYANEWALKALVTKSWPEPYFALGRSFYAMAHRGENPEYNYKRAKTFIMDGLRWPTDVVLFANPQERAFIHAQLNVCFHVTADDEKALWSCEEGLKACSPELRAAIEAEPDKYEGHPFAMMLHNRREYMKAGKLVAIQANLKELFDLGGVTEQQVALIRAALSGALRIETEAGRAPLGLPGPVESPLPGTPQETRADPGKLDMVLFLGPAYERWTPETWKQNGMGGSETMAWEMARRLRKLGHRVRVYTDCAPNQEGLYEGVEWVMWQRYRGVQCDVLVASRFPWAVDDAVTVNSDGKPATIGGCKATARLLWIHDVTCGPELNMARLQRYDRILCLSQWHKGLVQSVYAAYPGGPSVIPDEQVVVTRNGIDLGRFAGTEERNPHRAVYSSSPDRGLLAAVLAWPKVRESVPDAELHCFYGFDNWAKSARMNNDQAQIQSIAHLKELCRNTPGIVLHGRIGQQELAREFMRSGVWAYGTGFHETSCLTAMEAQAAGLLMVTSGIGALVETAGENGSFLNEKWPEWPAAPSDPFVEEYAKELVEAMTMPESDMAEFRKRAQQYARAHFGLDELAEEWDEMLTGLHAERVENPVGKFSDGKAAE